jgi:hypothetical protein
MRPWLSGITSPCQGLVGVSITPGRTKKNDPLRVIFRLRTEKGACAPFVGIETAGIM